MTPLISATMIVKNEEEMLPGCLESIKEAVDEIIIVDTGSTDRTVEIAKSYGAKVYHHPWQDSFSIHRNQAFSYATGEWCLVIDADERLGPRPVDAVTLRRRLKKIPSTVNGLVFYCFEMHKENETPLQRWFSIRLVRRSANPSYENTVHNKLRFEGFSERMTAGSNLEIHHYGYQLDKAKMRKKMRRTLRLLALRLHREPDDYNAMYYMCNTLQGMGRHRCSIQYGIRCLELLPIMDPKEMQYYGSLYYKLANSYLRINDGGRALSWALKGAELFKSDPDILFMVCLITYMAKMNEMFLIYAPMFLGAHERAKWLMEQPGNSFMGYATAGKFENRDMVTINPIFAERVRNWVKEVEGEQG